MTSQCWRDALRLQSASIKHAGLWRRRRDIGTAQQPLLQSDDQWLTSFAGNDYMGLAAHPKLAEVSAKAVMQWGVGAGASHLVCGHQAPHRVLEERLADFFGAERALLFANGYMANLALNTAFMNAGDLVLHDRLNHASLIDGGRLSGARFKRFAHKNYAHAQKLIVASSHAKLGLMSDGVFSMEGDVVDLPQLMNLQAQHNALLCIDDAHGVGVLGLNGRGTLSHFEQRPHENLVLMGTLGKAMGCYGAFVVGDAVFIEHMVQSARSYIYTTALPPHVAATASAALSLMQIEHAQSMAQITELVRQFKRGCRQLGLTLLSSDTPIQPVLIGDERSAVRVSEHLQALGFLVPAIRTPSVPKAQARLRVAITAAHTVHQVEALIDALHAAVKALDVLGLRSEEML